MDSNRSPQTNSVSRRQFIATTAATAALVATGNYAHAQGSDTIRVGLIGAGGRGSGAVVNCANSSPGVEVIAIGDLFPDHIESRKKGFAAELGEKYKVKDDHCFTGFDAYKKVL